jgi:tRNA1(Val) A37 N6-methylase TrmN6
MSEAIVVALITGGLSLAGVVITSMAAAKKTEKATAVALAVTDTKIEELTREVRAHNNFARRMPVVEEQIKGIQHRLSDLEGFHRPMS